MKIIQAILLVLVMGGTGMAAQSDPGRWIEECTSWNLSETSSSPWKTGWILGWLRGIEAADKLTATVIMHELWPTNHRVGSLIIEIDVKCRQPENRNALIGDIIKQVAREKNR